MPQQRPLPRAPRSQAGATLIEILVSLVILMLGLLGLIGVMVQSQRAQLESYQRVQALMLVQDMVARINTNRLAADCYVMAGALGTASAAVTATPGCALATSDAKQQRAQADLNDWRNLLLGSAEVSAGNNVGSILGARGCITRDATTGIYQVAVVWQGVQSVGAPPASITCGAGQYGTDDAQRRAVSVTLIPATAS
jgi:type IV pilus assembly protein PilV